MRIAFLVPRLQPGKDGVGDVTRRLASVLQTMGIECVMISWNDHCTGKNEWGYQFKIEEAWGKQGIRSVLQKIQPDWVSLQFIHYAFNSRGLMFSWLNRMEWTLEGFRWHLFFHEIWIGVHQKASLKHRALGWIQKQGFLKMIRKLKPDRIQTSNPVYQEILHHEGVEASLMKHCPSIVPEGNQEEAAFQEKMELQLKSLGIHNRSDSLWVLLFGAIHPEGELELFLPQLIKWGEEQKKKIVLISSGRRTPGEAAWKSYQQQFEGKIYFITLGEVENNFASYLMSVCDFGITTTPYQILGKSSGVVAMLEHGLPVLAYRDQIYGLASDRRRDFHSGVYGPQEILMGGFEKWNKLKTPVSYAVEDIAAEFLKVLHS